MIASSSIEYGLMWLPGDLSASLFRSNLLFPPISKVDLKMSSRLMGWLPISDNSHAAANNLIDFVITKNVAELLSVQLTA